MKTLILIAISACTLLYAQNPVVRAMSCSDAGSTDTYACSMAVAPAAYVTGLHYWFSAATANTGAATINFNSLGAKTIKKAAGGVTTDLADNDIRAGQWVDLVYDGTNMQMQSTLGNAASGGSGSATTLYYVGPSISTCTGAALTIATYTLPANTLAVGDTVEVISNFRASAGLGIHLVKQHFGSLSVPEATYESNVTNEIRTTYSVISATSKIPDGAYYRRIQSVVTLGGRAAEFTTFFNADSETTNINASLDVKVVVPSTCASPDTYTLNYMKVTRWR